MNKLAQLKTQLQPHQSRVVSRIQQEDQPGLVVAHGLGSGKTLTSIAAQEALGVPSDVVLPAALKANYEKERVKHLTSPRKSKAAVRSIEMAARTGEVSPSPAPLLIVDEAHRARDPSTKAYRALRDNTAKKRLLLTASPFYNHPVDIAPLVNVAAGNSVLPHDKAEFATKYVAERQVEPGFIDRVFRGVKPGVVEEINPRTRGELAAHLGKWVDYHPNSEAGFPRVVREDVPVEMTPEQLKVYDTLMGKAPFWVSAKVKAGLPPSKQESKQLNAFLGAVRQVSNSTRPFGPSKEEPKIQKAYENLKTLLDKNPRAKAVVYSNYLDSGVAPYRERLQQSGIPFGEFTGEMSKKQRDELVKQYNEDKIRTLLISSAGGEGLDLKGTRLLQVLEPHWNTEKLKQVEGRGIRYKSHEHLPEEEREVLVQRYLATRPRSGILEKFKVTDPGGSVDQYLVTRSKEKEQLNQQFRDLLASQNKTASVSWSAFVSEIEKIAGRPKSVVEHTTKMLDRHERGENIGATARARLKARGLIARADGTKRTGTLGKT